MQSLGPTFIELKIVWFPGKDLLAGMADWLKHKGFANPGMFHASMRDWVIEHPDRA